MDRRVGARVTLRVGGRVAGRRCRRWGLVTALLAVALLVPVAGRQATGSAAADPRYPSDQKVQQAKQAAAAKATQVAQLQAALAADSVRLDAARLAAEQAAEAYDAAQIELVRRTAAADQAQADADSADVALQHAQAAVGRLAAEAYREGGQPNLADAMFSSSTMQDLLDRSTMLGILGAQRVRTVQAMNNVRSFAISLQQRSAAARNQQQAATSRLETARTQAGRAASDATATVAAGRVQRQAVLSQLSALQATAVTLQQERLAGLAAEAAARQAAARRAAAGAAQRQSWGSGGPGGISRGTAQGGSTAVAWARRQLGLPYVWGGAGPDSYDCSGLTMRAWEQSGVNLPHYAASQYMDSEHLPYSSMRRGDLIFYATDTNDPATIHHVTMYVGDGMMIEAPYTGASVQIVPIRWDGAMAWAGRP